MAVIDGTEKFGSSSCPSRGKPMAPATLMDEDQEQDDGAMFQRPMR
jgi:hypothetical protein